MSKQPRRPFGRESAVLVLDEACSRVGLDPDGAELLRLGENAIYRLRSGRPADRSRNGSLVGRREGSRGGPMAHGNRHSRRADMGRRAAHRRPGPPGDLLAVHRGRRGGSDDVEALALVLRRMHGLPPPDSFTLPDEDVLGRVEPRIERAHIPEVARAFLVSLLGELRGEVARLDFPLPPTVTHGDAQVQNLMVNSWGAVLIDFERVAVGQPEWDLAMTTTEYVTAQWWSPKRYEAFVESYGFDVTAWSGFDTLRRVHEIKMTTWLMQNINESDDVADEYAGRMRTIRGHDFGQRWQTFQ